MIIIKLTGLYELYTSKHNSVISMATSVKQTLYYIISYKPEPCKIRVAGLRQPARVQH